MATRRIDPSALQTGRGMVSMVLIRSARRFARNCGRTPGPPRSFEKANAAVERNIAVPRVGKLTPRQLWEAMS